MKRIHHKLLAEGFSAGVRIIRKLKTAEQLIGQGKSVAKICRVREVSQPTYHRWRQIYGGMQAEEPKCLTKLEKENGLLKMLLA